MTDETPDLERWVLLARYAAGECSPAERARVERWLAADPSRRLVLEELRIAASDAAGLVEPSDAGVEQVAKAAAWRRLSAQMGARRLLPSLAPARPLATAWLGLAAALLIGISVWRIAVLRASFGASREYVTAPGQRETVTLADGTEFTLGPASRLALAAGYGVVRRDVSLEGEAFFVVVHDSARPFVVHAGPGWAQDVGTRFDVRAYPDDHSTQVVVSEGAVALADSASRSHSRVLARGSLGRVDARGAVSVTSPVEADRYTAWTRGELVFGGAPMREVAIELSRWYGADVRVDTSLAYIPLLASFRDEPVTDVLHSIAAAIGARVERDGPRFVLRRYDANH